MEWLFFLVPVALVLTVLGVITVITQQFEKKRTAALAEVAGEMSLDFAPTGDAMMQDSLSDVKLFQTGRSRSIANVFGSQTDSVDVRVFDYSYVTGSGKHKTTHKHTVVAFDSRLLDLPVFDLGPENLFHKLASKFGYQDIDFDGYPTFSGKYLLRGPDEAAIRETFTEDVVQGFEALLEDRKKILPVAASGRKLIVSITPRARPADVRSLLEHAFQIYGIFKPAEESDLTSPA